MFKRSFAVSRWLHRYLGLLLLVYLVLEGATGILLNHPRWIASWSVPRWMVPPSYRIDDWNRGALRTMVFSATDPSLGFLAGTEGVWKTADGGRTFQPMTSGYPTSRADRRTNHVLLLENGGPARLLAATRGGLFTCTLDDETWNPVALGPEAEEVRKVLLAGDRLIAVTASHVYASAAAKLRFQPVPLTRVAGSEGEAERKLTLTKLAFALHSGEIWGLPGRLLIDAVGLLLVFLSVSAMYMWYFPRAKRWFPRKRPGAARWQGAQRRAFQWLWRYHIDIGLWTAAFLVLIAATALFMPPSPLVSLSVRTAVPPQYWPGPLPEDPWHESIGNAAYDPSADEIVLEAWGALWRGPANLSGPFAKDAAAPPFGGMGTNVMEFTRDGSLVVGSFSGLYECRPGGGPVVDLKTGQARVPGRGRRSAGGWKVTGYFETPSGERFAVTHDDGIVEIDGAQRNGRFSMPAATALGHRMPLWNFLFEVHNGRIVRDWTGSAYFLIPVLGALGLLALCVSGLYDWMFRKISARRARRKASAAAVDADRPTPALPKRSAGSAAPHGAPQHAVTAAAGEER